MPAALLIAWKDLRQRARDRSAFLIALVVPLTLAFIFSQILGNVTGDDSITFHYGVANEDDGEVSRQFVEQVLASLEEQGLIVLRVAESAEHGRELAEQDVDAAFIIPAGFSNAVESGQAAAIEVVGHVDSLIGTLVANAVAEGYASELSAIQASVGAAIASGKAAASDTASLAARAAALADPITVDDVSASRKELEPKTFFAAGMAVFFLFFTVQFGISSLLDERRDGTLNRLLAAPIRRSSILAGKLVSSFVLGVLSMTVLAIGTSVLLGAEWGDPTGVAVLIVAGVLAAMAVMALVRRWRRPPSRLVTGKRLWRWCSVCWAALSSP